uniref:Uncharacterized protein n=1 Tax=Physcomitrium patens TaxID=3218 RepID=A0A2K1KQ53_PHYPA|nr:hypothetical protein PHYPA_006778 [Physcomitrium patens]
MEKLKIFYGMKNTIFYACLYFNLRISFVINYFQLYYVVYLFLGLKGLVKHYTIFFYLVYPCVYLME